MPKKIDYTLTSQELGAIEKAIKTHPNSRARQRAQLLRLLHLGHKPEEVASLLSTTRTSVYNCHARWREIGIDSLVDQPRSGRPEKGGIDYLEKLDQLIKTDPHTLGYGFNVWTAERLIAHLKKETAIEVHENTLLNKLKKLNYVFRRPKHDLGNLQDKKAKETAKEIIEALKKKLNQEKSNYSLWMKPPSD